MAGYGSYYKGDKKKQKKDKLEKEALKINRIHFAPQVEIIGKKKKT